MMNILGSNKQLILFNNYKSNCKAREDLVLFLIKNLTRFKDLNHFKLLAGKVNKNNIKAKDLEHIHLCIMI